MPRESVFTGEAAWHSAERNAERSRAIRNLAAATVASPSSCRLQPARPCSRNASRTGATRTLYVGSQRASQVRCCRRGDRRTSAGTIAPRCRAAGSGCCRAPTRMAPARSRSPRCTTGSARMHAGVGAAGAHHAQRHTANSVLDGVPPPSLPAGLALPAVVGQPAVADAGASRIVVRGAAWAPAGSGQLLRHAWALGLPAEPRALAITSWSRSRASFHVADLAELLGQLELCAGRRSGSSSSKPDMPESPKADGTVVRARHAPALRANPGRARCRAESNSTDDGLAAAAPARWPASKSGQCQVGRLIEIRQDCSALPAAAAPSLRRLQRRRRGGWGFCADVQVEVDVRGVDGPDHPPSTG